MLVMNDLQKKSLDHAIELLELIETHRINIGLRELLTKEGIDNLMINKIVNNTNDLIYNEIKKVTEAKSWLKCLNK